MVRGVSGARRPQRAGVEVGGADEDEADHRADRGEHPAREQHVVQAVHERGARGGGDLVGQGGRKGGGQFPAPTGSRGPAGLRGAGRAAARRPNG